MMHFYGQIAFNSVFDLYHNHVYLIIFSTFRSSVFTNGRFLFLTCYCAKCGSIFFSPPGSDSLRSGLKF